MGNTHAHHRRGSKQVVTVLQVDGRVLEFSHSVRVADLLFDYPQHFVCHSSALAMMQLSKMLPGNTLLVRGEVYFLLPIPKCKSTPCPMSLRAQNDPSLAAENMSGGQPRVGGTVKMLITKQQLAKILAEGSIDLSPRAQEVVMPLMDSNVAARSNGLRVLHRPSPTLMRRPVTWSPGLESISEVPVM